MAEISRAELLYQVERQREELTTLNSVGKLLSSTTEPQEVMRLLAAYLKRMFPIAGCAILSVRQRTLKIIPFATVSESALALAKHDLYGKTRELLRAPLGASDIQEQVDDASLNTGQWGQALISVLPSSHIAPLRFEKEVIALLSVFSGKTEAFSKEDQHVIDIVADQASAALRNAYLLEELRQANTLKNELLMLISHELHTPLTSISEGTNLMLDGALGPTTPDQREFLGTINQSASRLSLLVEKTLLATQLMTGRLGYTFGMVDLSTTLKEIQKTVQAAANAKGVLLEFAGLSHPLHAHADEKHIRYALLQLVENAIHATPKGGMVTIGAAAAGLDVEVRVTDTGAGIPAKNIETMFKQFSFTGTIDDRKTGGLGLGLFTCKAILEGHRGTIAIDSQAGQGTKIVVRLPTAAPVST